jgi:histone acetyltransferase (RNA polymerase elongator complex component)
VVEYGKVIRNFAEFEKSHGLKIFDSSNDSKIEMANELAAIAARYGIRMFSCCGDYLVGDKIKKAHCIDGRVIEELFSPEDFSYKHKPTRDECGCTESTDIGTYDTCPHGCVYCYANTNKQKAYKTFQNHDKTSAFLGYSKIQSDKWLKETQRGTP